MGDHISHMDAVAIRKSGIVGWEPFQWQAAGNDSILTGGIPSLLTRGPRKGRKTWDGKGTSVVVTRDEVIAEQMRYMAETGNCARCYGTGEVFASWHHIEGTKLKPCTTCAGTGKPCQPTT